MELHPLHLLWERMKTPLDLSKLTVEMTVKNVKTGEKSETSENNKNGMKKRRRTEKPAEHT
jgi:hypothetical protein